MWNRLNRPELTMMNAFSEQIWQMEQRRPGNFPEFDPAQPLLAFSDYGGAHAGARFESFSFLFLQPAALPAWEGYRRTIRELVGFTQGRMAYKRLNASDRERALIPWLHSADELPGLLVTVAIERALGRFFSDGDIEVLRNADPAWRDVGVNTIKRTFHICHLLSLFVAGLSNARQELIWITDEDEIAANETRLAMLRRTFPMVCGLYFGEPHHNFHCATTSFDDGSLQIEDLASLPDLVAGAFSDVHTQQLLAGALPIGHERIRIPESISPKSHYLLYWASLPEKALKRMVFAWHRTADGMVLMPKMVFFSEPRAAPAPG